MLSKARNVHTMKVWSDVLLDSFFQRNGTKLRPFSFIGRLIVEIVDHRNRSKPTAHTPTADTPTVAKMEIDSPTTKRVVLSPTHETLWADLSLLHEESGEAWSAQTMLEVESKILVCCLFEHTFSKLDSNGLYCQFLTTLIFFLNLHVRSRPRNHCA